MLIFERACDYSNWKTDTDKILNLCTYLEGIALKWYNSRIMDGVNEIWEEWKTSFTNSFGQNHIELSIAADTWEYRGGPILEYYFEKQRRLSLAYPDIGDYTFITMVMRGLPPDMQCILLNQNITTKAQLHQALERLLPKKQGEWNRTSRDETRVNKRTTGKINEIKGTLDKEIEGNQHENIIDYTYSKN